MLPIFVFAKHFTCKVINMKSYIWLDDKSKNITWLNRNYFFVTTLFVVLLNIVIFAVHGRNTPHVGGNYISLFNLLQALINCYTHANWQHTLLNMLCFFVTGLYLERKYGSLKFLLFVFILSLFTAFADATCTLSMYGVGFSGVNYGLYGYILVEYIYTLLQKEKRYLFNVVFGAVMVGLIYFAMCFCGGTSTVSFVIYPYDLLHNLAHANGFIAGILFALYEQTCKVISRVKNKKTA